MQNQFSSLITTNAQAGIALANELAGQLYAQMEKAADKVERPGGMNYGLPAQVPEALIAGILFYAIATANQGWSGKT